MTIPVFSYNDVTYDLFECRLREFLGRSKRVRCPEYLEWTRGRQCHCYASWQVGDRSEPHHYGSRGMGQKAPDWYVVPLCWECHRHWHDHARLRVLPGLGAEDSKSVMRRLVAENFLLWIKQVER